MLENPAYVSVKRQSLTVVRDSALSISKGNSRIYVDAPLGMEVAKYSNGRIYYPFYPKMAGHKMELLNGDVFVCSSLDQMNYIIPKVTNYNVDDFVVTEVIAPVKGLLRPGKFFMERGPEIGLYFLVKK